MTPLQPCRFWSTSLFLVAIAATGCEHADPLGEEATAPTFSAIQQTIFTPNCAVSGCHLGDRAPAQLDLSSGRSYANLVGVPSVGVPALLRVEPGNPDESYLVRKVEGGPGITGLQMPRGRDRLTAEQIQAIRDWIAAGAAQD